MHGLGRYELLLELARGGMAELHLGRLHGAGGFAKLVAIKRILPHLTSDRQFTEMFLQEGRIAAHLSHPNVCQVFELGEVDGQLFLAMEYLEGAGWDVLSTMQRPSPRLIAGVLAQAAEGLHYAHSLRDLGGNPTPVIHRDVSPQNLFVTVDGVCKVLDFGVSKMATDGSKTKSGIVKGKLPYMAPEQIRGEPLDGRADVFALGVCAWEAFAGARLFARSTDYQIWQAIIEEPYPRLSSAWPQCPPEIEAVVMKALAKLPAERQVSAQAFADDLRGVVGFAAASEIGEAVRTVCGARLSARQQLVAQAIAGRPSMQSTPPPVVPTQAGETMDIRSGNAAQASMQLREQSAVVERPEVRSSAAVTAQAMSAVQQGTAVAPVPKRSRTWLVALIVAIVAVGGTLAVVFALRSPATTVVPADAADDGFGNSIDRLGSGLERLGSGLQKLEKLRDVGDRLQKLRDLQGVEHTEPEEPKSDQATPKE